MLCYYYYKFVIEGVINKFILNEIKICWLRSNMYVKVYLDNEYVLKY